MRYSWFRTWTTLSLAKKSYELRPSTNYSRENNAPNIKDQKKKEEEKKEAGEGQKRRRRGELRGKRKKRRGSTPQDHTLGLSCSNTPFIILSPSEYI